MDCELLHTHNLHVPVDILVSTVTIAPRGGVLCGNSGEIRRGPRRCRQLYSYPDGQGDFAETTETENGRNDGNRKPKRKHGNGNVEGKKIAPATVLSLLGKIAMKWTWIFHESIGN